MPSLIEIAELVGRVQDAKPEALDTVVTSWASAGSAAANLATRAREIDLATATAFSNGGYPVYEPTSPSSRTQVALGDGGEHFARVGQVVGLQQDQLVETQPDLVGGLDGVPASIRDVANRDRIPGERARIDSTLPNSTSAPPRHLQRRGRSNSC